MPNLAAVIPVMDAFDEHLTTYSRDLKFLPSIRAAAGLAKKTLNRYYGRTDDSNAYRIAMGEPGHTLMLLTSDVLQFCTRATNCSISKTRNGKTTGSTPRKV